MIILDDKDADDNNAYFLPSFSKKISADKDNVVNGQEAFGFFLRSHLPNNMLGQIWEVSDIGSKGYLTEAEFYTAISLVGIAQAGGAISNIVARQVSEGQIQAPHPKFDG